jgi:hypothetical protein
MFTSRLRARSVRWALPYFSAFLFLLFTAPVQLTALPSAASSVTVEVFNGSAAFYTAPWVPNMSYMSAMEQALPTSSPSGSFSVNYFPQFSGFFISAVGGVPTPDVKKFWSTCLLPAAKGSTIFSLPLAVDRILVGPGDQLVLAFDTDCTKVPTTAPTASH